MQRYGGQYPSYKSTTTDLQDLRYDHSRGRRKRSDCYIKWSIDWDTNG